MQETAKKKVILVVDDNPTIRDPMKHVLEDYGYTVFTASDGNFAIEVVKELLKMGTTIHLLITDLVMPGMTGRRLYERLREQIPELKVIYMSGYHQDEEIRRQVAEGTIAFLPKPFEAKALRELVQKVLSPAP